MRKVPVAGKPHIYHVKRGGGRGKANANQSRRSGS